MTSPRKPMLCALLLAWCALAPGPSSAGPIDVAAVLPGPPAVAVPGADGAAKARAVANDESTLPRDAGAMAFTPLPEPDSVAIMAAGLGLAGLIVRRRRSGRLREG